MIHVGLCSSGLVEVEALHCPRRLPVNVCHTPAGFTGSINVQACVCLSVYGDVCVLCVRIRCVLIILLLGENSVTSPIW